MAALKVYTSGHREAKPMFTNAFRIGAMARLTLGFRISTVSEQATS